MWRSGKFDFFCGINLVWFPDDDRLWIETCKNIQCDSIISISKEQYCAFWWLTVANLSIRFMQKCWKKKQKLTILAKTRDI